jgi:peptide chain release factor 1
MFEKLEAIEKRYEELNRLIAQPQVSSNPSRLQSLAQERASIEEVVERYRHYKAIVKSLEETQAMLNDGLEPEMVALVKEEINSLRKQQEKVLHDLKLSLLPKDPNQDKDVIMEIRQALGVRRLPFLPLTFSACTVATP